MLVILPSRASARSEFAMDGSEAADVAALKVEDWVIKVGEQEGHDLLANEQVIACVRGRVHPDRPAVTDLPGARRDVPRAALDGTRTFKANCISGQGCDLPRLRPN